MSKPEVLARQEIYLERYSKQLNIEALTSVNMVKTLFMPVAMDFAADLAGQVGTLEDVGCSAGPQRKLMLKVSGLIESADTNLEALQAVIGKAQKRAGLKQAKAYCEDVFPAMSALREDIDALESMVPRDVWPVPTYADLMFKL